MQVTDVTAIPVEVPLKGIDEPHGLAPYATGTPGVTSAASRTLVRIDTSEDISGWGEMHTALSPEVTKAVVEQEVGRVAIGKDVWAVESLLDEFQPSLYVELDAFASGVELAMWDALGKHLGAPVHQLLGGKMSDEVPFAYAFGIADIGRSVERMQAVRDAGFPVLKTKVGGYDLTDPDEIDHDRSIDGDVARLIAMAEAVDGDIELRADANQSWTPEDAVRVGRRLEDAGVFLQYFEQPVRIDSTGTYKRLRERLATPIAVNEDMYFPRNFLDLVKHDAVDAGVVDMVPAGGIGPMKRLAGIAEEAGISLAHHCGFDLGVKTAAMLHAISTTSSINLPSDTIYFALADHVIEDPFEFENGTLQVPDDPGFGISVDEAAVERYRIA